jgi:predicted transposase YbfD/YdcC
MGNSTSRYRHPTRNEQEDLDRLIVRPIEDEERARFDELVIKHHYLQSAAMVGEHLRYVAVCDGQWLGLAAWSVGARHIKARDEWIGWSDEQRRRRLPLVVNNARLLILPECNAPNLVSRFMKTMLARLSGDWEARWEHPVAVVETFVDPTLFQGTCYKVSGWTKLGRTAGFGRCAGADYYQAHKSPKDLWVRELEKGGLKKLRAAALPPAWVEVEASSKPRCREKPATTASLVEHLEREVTEFRTGKRVTYPAAGMLALIAMAVFCGVVRGQRDLAAFAATHSQAQMRALKFRCVPRTKRREPPGESTFHRVLVGVDETAVERALLLWQEQLLGPAQDETIAIDGKKLRHANGVELVSAFGLESRRWLGSVCTQSKGNEIPAARDLLDKLEITDKTVVADALHTQHESARKIVFEAGGDYVFTVNDNQKGVRENVRRLLAQQPFSPREQTPPELADWELNRGRVELRTVADCQETTPGQSGFPCARQILVLNRRVLGKDGKMSNETGHLITSLEPPGPSANDLKAIKRAYWMIESDLHYRLDEVLDEDRSRITTPKAAHVLGMFRRLVLSLAISWTAQRKKTLKRTSTRDFIDHLRAHNARRAFDLVTAKSPQAWKAGK